MEFITINQINMNSKPSAIFAAFSANPEYKQSWETSEPFKGVDFIL